MSTERLWRWAEYVVVALCILLAGVVIFLFGVGAGYNDGIDHCIDKHTEPYVH